MLCVLLGEDIRAWTGVHECVSGLDGEAECACESLDSSELVEELDAFLRELVASVTLARLFDHAETPQFLQIL